MLNGLRDEDILEYLMNSEFNEGLVPDEYKFLLFKFRYYYRLTKGKYERDQDFFGGKINELEEEITRLKSKISKNESEIVNLSEKYNKIKNRKLSILERFKGKIIYKDEDKGI